MAARPRRLTLTRRDLLAAAAAGAALSACGQTKAARPDRTPAGARKVRYAEDHRDQFAELRMPTGSVRATVVLLHGGYWQLQYGLDLMRPLARRLTDLGYATWNVEYRRVGDGGGVPSTLEDVAAAVDRLDGTGLPAGVDRKVVLLGHSAGGHLAAWAASRSARTPGGEARVAVSTAISLAGVLDLTHAAGVPGSSSPVTAFVGGTPAQVPGSYAVADPTLLVPAGCPVQVVYAADDQVVPPEQAARYVQRARAAGGEAATYQVPGDHFTIIDPAAEAFTTTRTLVERATA